MSKKITRPLCAELTYLRYRRRELLVTGTRVNTVQSGNMFMAKIEEGELKGWSFTLSFNEARIYLG